MSEYAVDTAKKKSEVWEWTKAVFIAVLIALLIRTFLFAPVKVDGHSMDVTLQNGERLIVDKLVYDFHAPQRGDIIVFHATPERDFIKRVIAVGGDTVEARNGVVYVNGKPLQEHYLDQGKKQLSISGAPFTSDFGPVKVPQGKIFAMGDNRPNSYDCRMLGPVDTDKVVGRADLAFWPLDRMQTLN